MKPIFSNFKNYFHLVVRILFVVIVISFNLYAAAVSDNDGSAFITKAEFDSLKNNFQSQINQYNNSIDSKIDAAIASYLAGINVSKTQEATILFKDWSDVSCFSGNITPTFVLPDWNASMMYANPHKEAPANYRQDWKAFQVALKNTYTNATGIYNVRPLITGITEGTNWFNGAVWNGIATAYHESFVFSSISLTDINVHALNDPQNYDFTAAFNNLNELKLDGYYSNLSSSWTNRWGLQLVWHSYRKYTGEDVSPSTQNGVRDGSFNKSFNVNVLLEKDNNNKIKIYEHILQYDGSQSWEVSNENCLKTFKQCNGVGTSTNTNTSRTMHDTGDKNGRFLYQAFDLFGKSGTAVNDGRKRVTGAETDYVIYQFNTNATYTNDDIANEVLPSIGYLGSLSADSIKQFQNPQSYTFNKKSVAVNPVKLQEGLPLFYATKDTEITWSVNFKKGKTLSSGTWIDSTHNARLALSLGSFTNKDLASQVISISKDNGASYADYQICEIEKDTKIKFKMPNDGIVYAKWWDDSANYDTSSWIQTLDITKSNKFIYVLKDNQ